jgi:hypothetical protein
MLVRTVIKFTISLLKTLQLLYHTTNLESGDEFVIIVKQGSPTTYTCTLRSTGSQEFAIPGGTWAASITLLTSAHAGEISKFVMIYDEERGRFYVDPSTSRFPA